MPYRGSHSGAPTTVVQVQVCSQVQALPQITAELTSLLCQGPVCVWLWFCPGPAALALALSLIQPWPCQWRLKLASPLR